MSLFNCKVQRQHLLIYKFTLYPSYRVVVRGYLVIIKNNIPSSIHQPERGNENNYTLEWESNRNHDRCVYRRTVCGSATMAHIEIFLNIKLN